MFPLEGPLALLGIFAVGLGLNLTPCVYPMLSMTFSLFGKQNDLRHGHAFVKALAYVLGMASMYTALGASAALTGGFLGAVLQSKWVLLALAIFFIFLSLGTFGIYSLQAPSWLLNKIGQRKKHIGLVTLFFYGVVAGIFAAPCIGPPVLALLTVVGAKGDPVYAALVFFVMALGLGFPYLVIGTFTGLLKKLPRSGAWLQWMERFFGVLLLGLAGFYGALAFKPEVLPYLIPGMITAGAVYLGFFEKSGDKLSVFLWFKRAFAVTSIVAAGALWPAPHMTGLVWEAYTPAKLVSAQASGQPVIFDFYADWCIPCHELERFTFSNKEVQKELERFVRLRADMTRPDSDAAQALVEQFDIQGVPTILLMDARGAEVVDLRISGFVDAGEMLKILRNKALETADGENGSVAVKS